MKYHGNYELFQRRVFLSMLLGLSFLVTATSSAAESAAELIRYVTYPSVSFINDEGEVDGPVVALVRAINKELAQYSKKLAKNLGIEITVS